MMILDSGLLFLRHPVHVHNHHHHILFANVPNIITTNIENKKYNRTITGCQ